MRYKRYPWNGTDMPNPACGRIEATYGVKPGRKGSPESKHTRQDGALGNWMGRMTNRNQPVTPPALNKTGVHVCLRTSHSGKSSVILGFSGNDCGPDEAIVCQVYMSIQLYTSMSTGQRGRKGDRLASTPIVVTNNVQGNPCSRLQLRMGQPASDVAVWGRRSRSSLRTGKPFTWRRAPVVAQCSCKLPEHDMGNHHA